MKVPLNRQSCYCDRLAGFQSFLVRQYQYGNRSGYRSISNGASSGLWLKDTASILSPRWRHLSVCFGAVVPLVTPLKSNLFRYEKPFVAEMETTTRIPSTMDEITPHICWTR